MWFARIVQLDIWNMLTRVSGSGGGVGTEKEIGDADIWGEGIPWWFLGNDDKELLFYTSSAEFLEGEQRG